MNLHKLYTGGSVAMGLALSLLPLASAFAEDQSISNSSSVVNSRATMIERVLTGLTFSSLQGNKIQIELDFDGAIHAKPKVFQTDNPARIALDFSHVHSDLDKKMYAVNQGAVKAVYVAEALGRTRIIINLTESVPHEIKVADNKLYIIIKPNNAVSSTYKEDTATVESTNSSFNGIKHNVAKKNKKQGKKKVKHDISHLIPQQTITNIDFRRGKKGEGRILVKLSTPNTVVDVKESGGKVVLNFINTKLSKGLAKRYDVSDFATPVQTIDAQRDGETTSLTVTPNNGNYDYSSYQSDGMLIIDFSPMTQAEKEALLKSKFPYSGKKLTFNFQDIEVRSVLQILADFTGLNIVAADSVDGNVSLRLNDVPWDQALDLIMKSKGLAKRQAGNVVLVAPIEQIIKIETEELKAKKIVEQLEPLRTEYIQINYAKAEDIQSLLIGNNVIKSNSKGGNNGGQSQRGSNSRSSNGGGQGYPGQNGRYSGQAELQGLLSARGNATVDGRTNTIIVKDTTKQLELIAEMVKVLDVPIRQVMIEARIVAADSNFAQEIGVKFGLAKAAEIGNRQSFAVGAGNNQTFSEIVPDGSGSNLTVPNGPGYLVDLGANAIGGNPAGALAMTLARAADYVLNLELSALENDGRGEVLANPRVMTSDRESAYIKQGTQIAYETSRLSTGTNGTPVFRNTVIFKDAVLELKVTPQITPDGDVIMELIVKKDAPAANRAIDKKEVSTTVRVRDGQTIVLGGVYEGTKSTNIYKVPFLADLPVIGMLFKKKQDSESKRELLIFITPKVVKSTLAAR